MASRMVEVGCARCPQRFIRTEGLATVPLSDDCKFVLQRHERKKWAA